MIEFKLPDIGEGVVEGEIVKWLVKVGDRVSADQPIVEVMTDKATVEMTAPAGGVIKQLGGTEGEVLQVGQVLVVIDDEGTGAAPSTTPVELVSTAQASSRVDGGAAPVPAAPAPIGATAAAEMRGTDPLRSKRYPAPSSAPSRKVLAAPATRRRARELGVDLGSVPGSGPAGRVTREDLERFATAGLQIPAAPDAGQGRHEERVPLRGLRKRIAEHMVHAKHTAPHFTYVEEVDMSQIVSLRAAARDLAAKQGVKLTYLPFIIKALIPALREFPLMNASLDDAAGQIVIKRYYNIGIAVATPEGLVVGVVKDADRRSIIDLGHEISRLAEGARAGQLGLEDLKGGTFTITSTGNLGGVLATPIVNHPEVAIMGVHAIRERPVVVGGQIVVRHMMNLSVSLDHRVVDGAVAAEFCAFLIRYLEEPNLLLFEQ